MCIIAIKPKGKKMFDDNTIKTMFIANPDGAGFMYYNDRPNVVNHVKIVKGFKTCSALLETIHKMDLTDVNVIMHFRIGTSGLNDALNCHPYPLYMENKTNCSAKLGVAHNGILHDYNPPKNSKINDTQTFINKVLNNLSPDFVDDNEKLMLIRELIGTNKLAFLDNYGQFTTIGNFINDNGYLFSNNSYKEKELYPKYFRLPKPVKPAKPAKKVETYKTAERYISDMFWDDEPSDFWDDWDIRHPSTRH